ncbi:MAG: flavodoxin [Solobacterium sp.]|nr:flavodoxin [Solobacterium sp.]
MKKVLSILAAAALNFSLAACGSTENSKQTAGVKASETEEQPPVTETENTAEEQNQTADKDVLVVYFSATGNTEDIAGKIAAVTDAEMYEILPVQAYTEDDLNWHDDSSRTSKEQNDKSFRTEIGSDPVSFDGYQTIYIGYPIWWGEEPRIMDTFVESHDFTGITVIPFCTSGSSGIGNSGRNLAELAGTGDWKEGKRFGAGTPEEEIRNWVDSLK